MHREATGGYLVDWMISESLIPEPPHWLKNLSFTAESPGAEAENGDDEARCPEAAIVHDCARRKIMTNLFIWKSCAINWILQSSLEALPERSFSGSRLFRCAPVAPQR
jgi:hypothetical protein